MPALKIFMRGGGSKLTIQVLKLTRDSWSKLIGYWTVSGVNPYQQLVQLIGDI